MQLLDWLATLSHPYQLDLLSIQPVASDAGSRRYFRLVSHAPKTPTLIAVAAPLTEKNREFARIASLFTAAGLHVPHILESDFDHGFMLMTDLGHTAYLNVLQLIHCPEEAQPLFNDALNALIRWQCATQVDLLPTYSEALLRQELELFPTWYLNRHLGLKIDEALHAVLQPIFSLLTEHALAQPHVFVHRDYMPRNLMVCEPNPGIIDFQDAVIGPITYDLVSLLRDAFISWDEAFQIDCARKYWEQAKQADLPVHSDFSQFYRAFEWMGLQRHLKILGIFARLYYRDGKPPHYLKDTPRFLGYIRQVAERYREFAPLVGLLDRLHLNV